MNIYNKIQDIINQEAAAIQQLPIDIETYRDVMFLINRVHELGNKVITSGIGKAGQIALNIATTLSSTGTPAVFLHPAEAQHGDLGVIQPGDVLLCISNSGETREILELIELIDKLYQYSSISVIAITGNIQSSLAEKADHVLWTGIVKEVCPLGLTPTTSTTVMNVIGDILVVLIMEHIGFTRADYALRHHGGYLGKKART